MALGNDVTLKVGFDIDKFQAELAKTNGTLNRWASSVQSSLMGVAAGFSAIRVAEFALDISKLAGEAEGVRAAFDRLENSVQLMNRLKESTNNTVSELELMKRAVMASNFGISLEALPKLLEFATLRAKQTGQSVDYLVDSIVTGIGRKSKLILDNLGISAVELDEALGGVSTAASTIGEVADAVGRIAEKNLRNMAGFTDDAKTRLDQLSASWENLKVSIGTMSNNTGILQDWTQNLTGFLNQLKDAPTIADALGLTVLVAQAGPMGLKVFGDYERALERIKKSRGEHGPFLKEEIGMSEWILDNQKAQTAQAQEINDKLKERRDLISQIFRNIEIQAKFDAEKSKSVTPNGVKPVGGIDAMPEKLGSPFSLGVSPEVMAANAAAIDEYNAQADQIMSINSQLQMSWQSLATDVIASMAAAFGGGQPIGQALLKSLAHFGMQFGKQLIQLGWAKVALGVIEKNPAAVAQGLKAVAAGALLTAGSAALAASQSGGGGGSGNGGGSNSIGERGTVNSNTQTQQRLVIQVVAKGKDLVGVYDSFKESQAIKRGG